MIGVLRRLRETYEKNWPELYCACRGGLPEFVFARRPGEIGSSVPVFCYHVVEPDTFETDLEFLERNDYATINADTLLEHLGGHRRAPERSVVLSIDDGARNLYEVAFPLLQRYRMSSVAFLATRFHGHNSNDGDGESRTTRRSPCSSSQIREMHASGCVDFQSQTHEHRYVPRWPEPFSLRGSDFELVEALRGPALSMEEDFRLAKEILEVQLNKTVRHLAFPRFNGTKAALAVGRACGYQAFWWGTLPGRPDNRPGDPPTHVVRISGEFLRRLPGEGRVSLASVLCARYVRNLRRWLRGS